MQIKKLTMEAYLAIYTNVIHPLLDQAIWTIVKGLKFLPSDVKQELEGLKY